MAANETTRIYRIVVDASKAKSGADDVADALDKMDKQGAKTQASLERIQKSVSTFGQSIGTAIGTGIERFIENLVELAKSAFDSAAGLDELATQLGVTARFLQGAQFSAVQAGVSLDNLSSSVGTFTQKIGQASSGNKEVIESLNTLGVKILDTQGQLRPTENILTEVSRAIAGIGDPAKQSAAAMEFFGKSGTKLVTMLSDLGKGYDSAAKQAEAYNAMIGPDTLARLDAQADKYEKMKLQNRAFYADLIASGLDWLDKLDAQLQGVANSVNAWFKRQGAGISEWWSDTLTPFVDGMQIAGVRAAAMFVEAWRQLPTALGGIFASAMNKGAEVIETGLNLITSKIAQVAPWMGVTAGGISIGRPFSAETAAGVDTANTNIMAAGDRAEQAARQQQAAAKAAADAELVRRRQLAAASDFLNDATTMGGLGGGAPGARNPAPKATGGGNSVGNAIAKLRRDTSLEFDKQSDISKVADDGAAAVANLEIHFKALKQAQDAYGKTADANKDAVSALAAQLEETERATENLKLETQFKLQTQEIERGNTVLQAKLDLMDAAPDVAAREIAALQVRNDIQKTGVELSQDEIDKRVEAVTQTEQLRIAQEDANKAQELWTAPLKQGLEDIQSSASDAWEQILDTGQISFQSLGDVFVKTIKKMAAEFLALATIRPVMSVFVEALGDTGLISPSVQRSLGYGSSSSSGAMLGGLGGGGGGGGGGLNQIFGGSDGQSGLFGGNPLGFLSRPIIPAQYGGAGSYDSIDDLLSQGSPAGLGGTTWGQGIGAVGGIAGGAYQLANSRGNTAKTIGAIGTMIGAGVSLIPGVGQIAGPLIMMASSILPSLFGGGDEKPPVKPTVMTNNATIRYTAGGWDSYGASPGDGYSLASNIQQLFDLTGGTPILGKVYGGAISTGTNNAYDDKKPYTNAYLNAPDGSFQNIANSVMDKTTQQIAEELGVLIVRNTIGQGGLSGVSPTLMQVMGNTHSTTFQGLQTDIQNSQTYDDLIKGDNLTQAEQSLRSINKSFSDISTWAKQMGLDVDALNQAKQKQIDQVGEDFLHTINSTLDPVGTAMADFVKQRDADARELAYINDNIKDVTITAAQFQEYEAKKEADLKKQLYGDAISTLQQAIDAMTTGSLANLSPTSQLDALGATYHATLAQAQAGDADAISRLASEGTNYVTAAQQNWASGPEYQAIVEEVRRALTGVQASVDTPTPIGPALPDQTQATQSSVAQIAQLTALVQQLFAKLDKASDDNAQLQSMMQRYVVKRAA